MRLGQIKVYGMKEVLNPVKDKLSDIIHRCMVEALKLPAEKKFQRFFPMDKEDFYYADGRSEAYTIIEISMFEGRSAETKKRLIKLLFDSIRGELGIASQDIEITIFETPKHIWGIRGLPGDELALHYKVNV